MWNRPANDTNPMYLDAFKYALEAKCVFRPDEYFSMCLNMSEPEELPFSEHSEALYNAILACKELILDHPYNYVISYIKPNRENDNIPRSHFWWYIDEL
ncbi:MAG: hypothetical protein M0Q16_09680 [Candidatus Cloacimonetes bacterium]|jgi:hypothetical protein|nr:hypothetical protein [Candidatus Cloacimonadota bacterium]